MHDLVGAVEVRQVELEHVDVRQRRTERGDACRIRSVAAPDEECPLVEPDRVAAVRRGR